MSISPGKPDPRASIPESLRLQLDDFRRLLWRVKAMEAVAAGFIGLLVSFLLVYGLDRFWQTPGWVRLAILLAGVSLFAGFAPYWLHRWVWKQRRESELARLIAKRYPGLGDRLLGVIELQQQNGDSDSVSPRLREAAMEAVAAETGQRKLAEALPPQRHRLWSLGALGLAALSAILMIATPRAGLNALQRWIFPLSDTQRYTFTKLDNPPSKIAVAFGEAFDVNLRLSADSEQRPVKASGRYGLQPGIESSLNQLDYQFSFPGQQDPGVIVFRIGDLRHEVSVEPLPRPGVESVRALVRPPAYLGIPERSVDLNTGVVSGVEGSSISIELITNRPLESASYGPTIASGGGEQESGGVNYTPVQGSLEISGASAKTPAFELGSVPFEIPFSWQDKMGLGGGDGFKVRIDALKDAAPVCYLQGIDRQKAILPEETVDFEVLAEDDFGVKFAGIEWSGQFSRPTSNPAAKGEIQLVKGAAEQRRAIAPAAFSPAAFGIEPQKITLRGYTEDYLPNRGRVYSEPVVLYILTRDEHAQMLKGKFDRNLTEFEDLARREQDLLDENERLERMGGEELQKEENLRRAENQADAESESSRRMDELSENMEQLMKDAARNGDIDKETLKKMADAMKSMQELSKDHLPKVKEKLGDATDAANTPEKSEKDMAEAVEEQKKAVQKMKDAIEKANDANRRFEAGTFVNRLKKAAGEQNGIVSSLVESYEKMLGVKTTRLDPTDQRRLNETSGLQANTASDIRWLQEDLGSYFARTQNETFKAILDEMKSSGIDGGLESVRTLLSKNHTYMATESSKKWADKLTAWAKKLEGEKDANGGGGEGGGGGGGPSPEDEDFEFMLRVMKLIQQEQDIRAQTRALEQMRRESAGPPTGTDQP